MGEFDQLPVEAFSTSPLRAVPLIVGRTVFTGPAGGGGGGADGPTTTALALLVAEVEPPAFDAVTTARSVLPTSSATGE